MSQDFTVKVDIKTDRVKRLIAAGLEKGLTMAALTIDKAAKGKAPVDTGRLRASIGYEVSGESAVIGTNVEYARWMEFGSSRKNPNCFLRPALDENRGKVDRMISNAVKGALK